MQKPLKRLVYYSTITRREYSSRRFLLCLRFRKDPASCAHTCTITGFKNRDRILLSKFDRSELDKLSFIDFLKNPLFRAVYTTKPYIRVNRVFRLIEFLPSLLCRGYLIRRGFNCQIPTAPARKASPPRLNQGGINSQTYNKSHPKGWLLFFESVN